MAWSVIQVFDDQPVVIAEILQEKKASIPKMVMAFRTQYPAHVGGLQVFPDASAGNASAGGQSMLEIMEHEFTGYTSEVEFYVPKKNPRVPDRIHGVNQILRGANLWKPIIIDASCEILIEDFQRVQWNQAGTGIQKCDDPLDDRSLLTHASDGFGYWVMMDMPSSYFIETAAEVMARVGGTGKHERTEYHGGIAGV
jgi:hypothetical protein